MAIRFYCQKCQKPIEVDDADAGKNVLCFYCRQQNPVPMQSDAALATEAPGASIPGEAVSAQPAKSPALGIAGLIASLAMIAALIFILGWGYANAVVPTMRTPDFAKRSPADQQKLLAEKMNEVRKQPVMRIASFAFIILLFAAIATSLAGIFTRRGTNYAIAGLVITLIIILLIAYSTYLSSRQGPAKPQARAVSPPTTVAPR